MSNEPFELHDDIERQLFARIYAEAYAAFTHPEETVQTSSHTGMEYVTQKSGMATLTFHRPINARIAERREHARTEAEHAVLELRVVDRPRACEHRRTTIYGKCTDCGFDTVKP